MKSLIVSFVLALTASKAQAQNVAQLFAPRTVGQHVEFAILNQLHTFTLERWVGDNGEITLSTCVAIGQFVEKTDKIYELAQLAYLTREMPEVVRQRADELAKIARSLQPFCFVNQRRSDESYESIVSRAREAISALQQVVR